MNYSQKALQRSQGGGGREGGGEEIRQSSTIIKEVLEEIGCAQHNLLKRRWYSIEW